jgi:hypothetical protein
VRGELPALEVMLGRGERDFVSELAEPTGLALADALKLTADVANDQTTKLGLNYSISSCLKSIIVSVPDYETGHSLDQRRSRCKARHARQRANIGERCAVILWLHGHIPPLHFTAHRRFDRRN